MTATATAPRPPRTRPARSPGASTVARLPPRRRRRLALTGLVGVVLLGAVAWVLLASSAFATREVRVEGLDRLEAEQVRAAAAVPIGVPLARQDIQGVAERVTRVPQVAAAHVTRAWPRAVLIRVEERQPLLAVRQPDGYAMVDRGGVAYETRPAVPRGVLQAQVDPHNQPLLAALGTVAQSLPPAVRAQVRHLAASSPDDLNLTLESGVVVHWGSEAQSSLKGELVRALLGRHPRASIDVSSPHNTAVR